MMKRRLIADLFHAGVRGLYVAACGCGVKAHIPSCIRKKAVTAAPALSGCGYGCCFGHSTPCKDANIEIIYKRLFYVKKNLSTFYERENVDNVDKNDFSHRYSVPDVEK